MKKTVEIGRNYDQAQITSIDWSKKLLKLGIDASNISSGGGLTHLVELLRVADPSVYGFKEVVVWASRKTLSFLEDRPWLTKYNDPILESNYLRRALWQRNCLGKLAKAEGCSLLFVPGGSFSTKFRPVVTMCQNMIPFELRELKRYRSPILFFKLFLLRYVQTKSFRKADGLIFLTQYAKKVVLKEIGKSVGKNTIIPHGIDKRFFVPPRPQKDSDNFNDQAPCRILYVSHIEPYKHQWVVAQAISQLKKKGFQVRLELIGPEGNAIDKLKKILKHIDPESNFIVYQGAVPYEELHKFYLEADINVYASSCENMPNIVLEAMASGLPIACSQCGPMPEILGDAGVFFDPERPEEIADAIQKLLESRQLRKKIAYSAFERAHKFSWDRCAEETFTFFREVSSSQRRK